MNLVSAFAIGLVFGLGLLVSGMTDPAKVLDFLDLAGAWDPSLAIVMGAALAAAFPAFRLAGRRERSWLGEPMRLPAATRIDRHLLGGAVLFGIGWGLAGICPGPAVVVAGMGQPAGLFFLACMLAGMGLYELNGWRRAG